MNPAERIILAVFGLVFAVMLVLAMNGCELDDDVPPEPFTPQYPPCAPYSLPDVAGDSACLHPEHMALDADGGTLCKCPPTPPPDGLCSEWSGFLDRCPGDSDGGGE